MKSQNLSQFKTILLIILSIILVKCDDFNNQKEQQVNTKSSATIEPCAQDSVCKTKEIIINYDEHFDNIIKSIKSNDMNYNYVYSAFVRHISERIVGFDSKGEIIYRLGPDHALSIKTNIDTKNIKDFDPKVQILSVSIMKIYQKNPY